MVIQKIKTFFNILGQSFVELKKNDPLRMASATAFFTTFALPPILIILIRLLGLFTNRRKLATNLLERLNGILDNSSVEQIRQTLRNFRNIEQPFLVTILTFIFLIFVATTLFNVIKNSLDQIWMIGMRPHKGLKFGLKIRAKSFLIILLAGILFFAGIITQSVRTILGDYTEYLLPKTGHFLNSTGNEILFIAIVTLWFTVLFRYLPNGRPIWKLAFKGGFLTGVLFTIGKNLINPLLNLSNIGHIYGASGSIVLIMLFVFYSSFIFYFGACFIKVLSVAHNQPIILTKGAFKYEFKKVYEDDESEKLKVESFKS